MSDAFFTVHDGLTREGPGEPGDVAWACAVAGLAPDARICDAGCGTGADIPALLAAAPEGRVTAIDSHKPFVEAALARFGDDPRVKVFTGNMAKLKGPFDFIWSAGAVYFIGIEEALLHWRPALKKGGHVAFSEPCFFADTPSDRARVFWDGYAADDESRIAARVRRAGWRTVASRRLSDTAWENYYTPLAERIEELRGEDPDDTLTAALDMAEAEIGLWREVRGETGYLLSVVRPQ